MILKFLKKRFCTPYVVKATYDEKTETMTVTWSDGDTEQYEGSGTVWYKMPYMRRCGTSGESMLCELWTYFRRYGNDYPTAHEKFK